MVGSAHTALSTATSSVQPPVLAAGLSTYSVWPSSRRSPYL
jgi:hypothetical protein